MRSIHVELGEHYIYEMDAVKLTASIHLISMDQEGIDWLEENFPDWRKQIGETEIEVDQWVTRQIIVQMHSQDLLKILTGEIACRLAEELMKIVEPKVEGLEKLSFKKGF
jgi:hypothetical protein